MNHVVEFDFEARKSGEIPTEKALAAIKAGRSCWIDIDADDKEAAAKALRDLGVDPLAADRILAEEATGRLVTHADSLHIGTSTVSVVLGSLKFSRLDMIVTKQLILTVHRGPLDLIDNVRVSYKNDFQNFAKSMGFMLYEIFDRLADGYRRAIRLAEADVERFQTGIYGEVDDKIFDHVAKSNRDLLALRTSLVSVQDILHKLVTRKSHFVAETTIPFLENIAGALDRLEEDLSVARGTLHESLELYMGMVSHRTNRVVTRLTAVNMIFLPLTFLCGVYGMNFHNMPEIEWENGYFVWWVVALTLGGGLLAFMKQRKWL